ncbi:hypothetical protein Halhy_6107 [Haliscomenobacter hydrossis DSM 1100]|uniref:Uncharacterized protein n=2 Tax=Haliscomenobacter TaxID=2349 RepID=F4L2L1_HALH1|nr:hypothetical protein Halhy_6107 [Haliscomenobacter hydrossis DSM 1100]
MNTSQLIQEEQFMTIHPFVREIVEMLQPELIDHTDLLYAIERYVLHKQPNCPRGLGDELLSILEGMRYLHRQKMKLSTQQLSFELRKKQQEKQLRPLK